MKLHVPFSEIFGNSDGSRYGSEVPYSGRIPHHRYSVDTSDTADNFKMYQCCTVRTRYRYLPTVCCVRKFEEKSGVTILGKSIKIRAHLLYLHMYFKKNFTFPSLGWLSVFISKECKRPD